jgi:hypothetical protein
VGPTEPGRARSRERDRRRCCGSARGRRQQQLEWHFGFLLSRGPARVGRLLIVIVAEEHMPAVRCLSLSNPALFTSPRDISPPPRRSSEASPPAALAPLPPASLSHCRHWNLVGLCSASIAASACTHRFHRFLPFAASRPPLHRTPSAPFHSRGFALRTLRGGPRL